MRRDDSISNPTRELILKYIQENPGLSLSRLLSFFGISKGSLRYHLDYLERSGEIRKEKDSGRSVFYASTSHEWGSGTKEMSKPQIRVLNLIRGSPGITRSGLLKKIHLSKDGLRYHLRRLGKKNLVEKVESDDGECYYPLSEDEVRKRVYLELVRRLIDGEIDEETFLMISKRV